MRIRLDLNALHQLMARSALSQNHWAVKLGLSKGHFSNLLSGKHLYPSARTRERMLEVLGVPFEQLFEIEPGQELPEFPVQAALRDRYLIDRQIGQGGMGIVYLARDLRLGRPVAIKIVNAEVVSGVGSKALLKEIINTNRLQHPNILPVLDAGEADGSPFYVLPYVRGGSLRDRLQSRQRLSVRQSLSILSGVGAALDHAHAAGILHCDVKPANILLSDDHAYLIDFGVARVVQAEVWTGEWRGEFDSGAGTPAYVSPEQARGDAHLDGRTDVYSLACTTYEMLSGQPPFVGDTTLATVAKRFAESPPALRKAATHVPTELSDAVQAAMAVNCDARTRTAGRFVAECHRAVVVAGSVVGLSVMQASSQSTRKNLPDVSLMSQNFRHVLRGIVRAPGVAIAIGLTLGLGIGVNAVMFQLIDRLFFKPPAGVVDAESLRRVYMNRSFLGTPTTNSSLSFPILEDIRATKNFSGSAAWFNTSFSLGRGAEAKKVAGMMTTHDFFPLLGVRPALGRFYDASEDVTGVAGTAVLSYRFWQRHFNGDPKVLGRVLNMGRSGYTVVGVAPKGFTGIDPADVDVFVPLRNAAHENIGGPWATSRGIQWLRIVARIAPGANATLAEAEATTRLRAAQQSDRRADPKATIVAAPLLASRGPLASQDTQVSLWLTGVAAVLLTIACANVINLLLTRLTFRETEFAIRAALGSGRGRLVKSVLLEAVVLALIAGVIGLGIAQISGSLLGAALLPGVTWPSPLTDVRVVVFTLGIALLMGVLSGALPAWQGSRTDIGAALKIGRGSATAHRSRLRSALLVFQAALSVVLLIGAGLFVRSMGAIRQIDSGLNIERLLVVTMDFDPVAHPGNSALLLQQQGMERLKTIPGIVAVTGSNSVPFYTSWAEELSIPGVDSIPTPSSGGPYINVVGDDYFRTVGTVVRSGRAFTENDRAGALRVAIVGETMARLVWPGQNPIGRCMKIGGDTMPCTEIVGVARDAPRQSLLKRENAQYYVPAAQVNPDREFGGIFVQTAGDPARVAESVRRVLQQLSPSMPFVSVRPMWELVAPEARSWQLGATLFTVFGVLALLVAALGLYSVVTFDVSRRTKELGIRIALGVSAARLMRLVFRSGLRPIVLGVVVGAIGAGIAARWVQPLLFSTSARDPIVYVVVALGLLLAACVAIVVPALRVTRISPVDALRAE
jgi:putative ABC transport system permease protein